MSEQRRGEEEVKQFFGTENVAEDVEDDERDREGDEQE